MVGRAVDFFFVGFPKSGTTTYYHLLKAHPEIFVPDIKEINFFNSDYNREMEKRLGADYFQLVNSEMEYLNLFRGSAGRIMGDFNPIYIFSRDAPASIFRHNPNAKILIAVREPVSFLRSFHFQSLYNMIEDEPDFLRALSLEGRRRAGESIPRYCPNPFHLMYSFLVEYADHIKQFVDVFGVDRIKLILFDDIVKDEGGVYREILQFLNVGNTGFSPPRADRNPSHALRFARLRRIVLNPRVNKWLYTKIPPALLPLGAKISQRIFKKEQEKPHVSHKDIERLKLHFRSNVFALNTFLNETGLHQCDLVSLWGYQDY